MDINKHNEKIWDEYLKDYGLSFVSKSDRDIMTMILFAINGVGDKKVLDLGVGTGRTTEILLSKSKEYIGTDYSSKGIEICKSRFPDGEFMVNDFTEGLPFDDNSYDFVFLSFNGIDYCVKEKREFAINEMFRVSNKWICYSTHDLNMILDDRIWNTNYIGLEKEEDRIKLVKENDWSLLEHKKEKGLITYFEKYDYTINYLNEKYNPSELRVVPNLDWENSAHWGFNYFLIEK